ncbi:hypothetical protein D3C75_349170 [compost metagenome]
MAVIQQAAGQGHLPDRFQRTVVVGQRGEPGSQALVGADLAVGVVDIAGIEAKIAVACEEAALVIEPAARHLQRTQREQGAGAVIKLAV